MALRWIGGTVIRPQVRPKIPPPDGSVGRSLNADGKSGAAPFDAGKDLVERRIRGKAKRPLQIADAHTGVEGETLHDPNSMFAPTIVKAKGRYSPKKQNPKTWCMVKKRTTVDDVWPQREHYRARLDAYLKAVHKTQTWFAQQIGYSNVSNLRQAIYTPSRRMEMDKLQNSAALFATIDPNGCSVSEFMDDIGKLRPTSINLSEYSQIDRYRFDQMIQILGNDKLTDQDRQDLFEEFRARVERVISIKERSMKR